MFTSDGKPEPRPTHCRVLHATHERLKDFFSFRNGDADARIVEVQQVSAVASFAPHRLDATRIKIGVALQVHEDLLESPHVDHDIDLVNFNLALVKAMAVGECGYQLVSGKHFNLWSHRTRLVSTHLDEVIQDFLELIDLRGE